MYVCTYMHEFISVRTCVCVCVHAFLLPLVPLSAEETSAYLYCLLLRFLFKLCLVIGKQDNEQQMNTQTF